MLLVALVSCIIISVGSFAWGYHLESYEAITRWILVLGILWLAALYFRWRWFHGLAVLLALGLSAFGIWHEFILGWMFNGAVFAVFAWNMNEFQEKMKVLLPREDKAGMTRRHLLRIGWLALGTFLISMILGLGG